MKIYNKLVDALDFEDLDILKIAEEMGDPIKGIHRKPWEFFILTLGLRHYGMLQDGKKGLALGAGTERMMYFLSNFCEITATDLYSPTSRWIESKATIDEVYNKAPIPYNRNNLTVLNMDMRKLDFPNNYFDFVYSACSIEHMDTLEEVFNVFKDSKRILKPGGIIAFTSEYVIDFPKWRKQSLYCFDEEMVKDLVEETGLEILGERSISISNHKYNEIYPITTHNPHIRIKIPDGP